MSLVEIVVGPRFRIFAWKEGDRVRVQDFLEETERSDKAAWKKLRHRFNEVAQSGIPPNPEKFKWLKGARRHKIGEFKAHGFRIYCYQDGMNLIVCTHGGGKRSDDTDPEELERACRIIDLYLLEKEKLNPQKRK